MSDIQPIKFDEASDDQRRSYVTDFLNLEVPADATPEQINALIRQAQPGSDVLFVRSAPDTLQNGEFHHAQASEAPEGAGAPEGQQIVGGLGRDDPRALIHIPVVETPDGIGDRDIVVGVNGRNWQLKRGHDLNVPWRVVEALGLTIQEIIRHEHQPDGNVLEIRTNSRRFPVQVLERPSQSDLDAWFERTRNAFCP